MLRPYDKHVSVHECSAAVKYIIRVLGTEDSVVFIGDRLE